MDFSSLVTGMARGGCATLLIVSAVAKLSRSGRAERIQLTGPFSHVLRRAEVWLGLAIVEAAIAISVVIVRGWPALLAPTMFFLATGIMTLTAPGAQKSSCGCYGAASRKVTRTQKRLRVTYSLVAAGITWVSPNAFQPTLPTAAGVVLGGVVAAIAVAELRVLIRPVVPGFCAIVRGAAVGRTTPADRVLDLALGSQAHMVIAHLLPFSSSSTETWRRGLRWRFLSWECVVNGAEVSANVAIYLPRPERSKAVLVRRSDGVALLRI